MFSTSTLKIKLRLSIAAGCMILIGCNQTQEKTVIDIDGSKYSIKKYGETIWMTQNLKTKQNRSGIPVKHYYPDDDPANTETFGLLYDFETACMVCPDGWELPTNQDWDQLIQLNGGYIAGTYKDPEYWNEESNTNSSLFSARPAGSGNNGEHENHFKSKTLFWSRTKEDEHFVWSYILELGKDSIRLASQHPTYAFSVRCIKSKN